MMNKFQGGDVFHRVKSKLRDIILFFYWRIRLGKLGRGSFIKQGVRIDGNASRISIGSGFKIWDRCFLAVGQGRILIGNNGLLGVNSYLNASKGVICIGNNVAISPFCQIYSYSHHYEEGQPVTNSFRIGNVTIEDNVLIGSNVIILPGVTIHKGAIVGAGAVVTKDVPAFTMVGGIPAKQIKILKED